MRSSTIPHTLIPRHVTGASSDRRATVIVQSAITTSPGIQAVLISPRVPKAQKSELFGKALGEHEGVGFMLADNEIDLHQSRLAIWRIRNYGRGLRVTIQI